MAISLKKYLNIIIHVLGWAILGFLLIFYKPLRWNVEVPTFFWLWQSIVLVMMVILFYTNMQIIVPATIIRGRSRLFIAWILAVIFVTQVIAYTYAAYTDMHNRIDLLLNRNRTYSFWDNFMFTTSMLMLAFSTGIAMLNHWQLAYRQQKINEQDKILAELAMLKLQINPHFFFNSLNSVYSLTYLNVEDSRKALLILSRMMRYLLYSVEDKNTSLLKEVDFLQNYIAIMRLRATEKVAIKLDIQEDMQDYPIAPMLLLPFVENAFKHGINPTTATEINIKLRQEDNSVFFNVTNCFFDKRNTEDNEGGIGLTNTSRRLGLLYPGNYQLSSGINGDGKYEVNLQIDLNVAR